MLSVVFMKKHYLQSHQNSVFLWIGKISRRRRGKNKSMYSRSAQNKTCVCAQGDYSTCCQLLSFSSRFQARSHLIPEAFSWCSGPEFWQSQIKMTVSRAFLKYEHIWATEGKREVRTPECFSGIAHPLRKSASPWVLNSSQLVFTTSSVSLTCLFSSSCCKQVQIY